MKVGKPWHVQHLNVDGCNCGVCQAEEFSEKLYSTRDYQTKAFIRKLDEWGVLSDSVVTVQDLVGKNDL